MRELISRHAGADCLVENGSEHLMVAPRSAEQASAIMKLAAQEGWRVRCAGAGTRNSALHGDVVMSSRRLDQIAEYEPADLVIGVQTGVTLPRLQEVIAPHNQFFALDPSVTEQSSIGAMVATGSAGPLRFAHGTPRDQVLGLEVVTGDGRVQHFGGRVVKNVAGYDIVRLLVGSYGTLGFITRVHVRLKPQPEIDRTVVLSAGSFERCVDAAEAIVAARLEPVALEIVSDALTAAVSGEAAWALLVRLQGNQQAVTQAVRDVTAAAELTAREVEGAAPWQRLAALEAAAPVNVRFANLPSRLRETVALAREASQTGLRNARIAAHAGDGIVRVLADEAAAEATQSLEAARQRIAREGGTMIMNRAPAQVAVPRFGELPAVALMQQIKKVFDPAGILGSIQ